MISSASATTSQAQSFASDEAGVTWLDLYIVAGQSNAVGADAEPDELPKNAEDGRVLLWWKTGDPPADMHDSSCDAAWLTLRVQPRGEPIEPRNNATRQYGNFTSPQGGFGPEIGLARRLLESHPERYRGTPALAVLKVAYSGTSVEDDWNPDRQGEPGNCLRELIDQFALCKTSARELGIELVPRGLIWVQGESDSDEARAAKYPSRLSRTLTAIREGLGVADLEVRLTVNAKFIADQPERIQRIVDAQRALAADDAHCEFIDTSSASIANDYHFDAAGTLQVGQWMADSFQTMLGDDEKTNVDAAQPTKLKILVTGGHPDDPETGCGGTIARYAQAGHDVTVVYLTTGEGGIEGKTHDEAAAIRQSEAIRAAVVLGAKPVFFGQIDGDSFVNRDAYREMLAIFESEKPDVVFTQWPIDSHRDHRVCSILTYDAWASYNSEIPLYYYEVMSGVQTQTFQPTDFVDITSTLKQKHKACFLHVSQKIREDYEEIEGRVEAFRGKQSGTESAEAFVRQVPASPSNPLPK